VIIHAAGQYRVLSWSGDVKIMQGGKFFQLANPSIALQENDAVWIANEAKIELGCPDGSRVEFNGPRFSRVATMAKS